MSYFVFRNNTIERFFPKDYRFSGYDDISFIPEDADGYIWFYQFPFGSDEELLCSEVNGYSQKLDFVLSRINTAKPLIALTMDTPFSVPLSSGIELMAAVEGYNTALVTATQTHNNLKLLDIREFTRRYPASELLDWKFWFISQMGMNPKLSGAFAEWLRRKLDEVALKRKKCLVLDLDNTLWGGVLGEDGIDGIKLGGDYPGKAFHYFQEALLALVKSGVILTVCSKNNETDVLDAWEKNPFMVLRKESFAAWRINWLDKAANIRELAEELNIGLDSLVFVDDNPSERELIRQMLPMVEVPKFPEHPYELPVFFKSLVENYFRVYSVTAEDLRKTEQYKANALRAQAERGFADYDSFLDSLDMRLTVEEATEFSIPRIVQMTQKTNQFNLTTKRYKDSDIRTLLEQGSRIWSLAVADRFGDSGITGCIIVDGNEIDSFLLSCRILGKGIENAFLKRILALLKESGVSSVMARFIPTSKNALVSDFYDRNGFKKVDEDSTGGKTYTLDLADADLQIGKCYHITEM